MRGARIGLAVAACVLSGVVPGVALPTVPLHSDTTVIIETTAGAIVVELDELRAPRTTANFLRYVGADLYRGGSFYRTVRQDNQPDDDVRIEVIQGGVSPDRREQAFDPIRMEGTGTTGLRHLDGTISMARGDPHSARGEFFICIGDQPELDEGGARNPDGQGFAAFGRVVAGMDVVRDIHRRATEGQRLVSPVEILVMRTAPAGRVASGVGIADGVFDAPARVAAWVEAWGSYDLEAVRELFLPDARVTYLSSEREGLIVGFDEVIEHHRGFGFVAGGVVPEQELWVEEVHGTSYGSTAVVTGVWYFGDRSRRSEAQRGPMTAVYTLYGSEYRIAHMHFANYEP